MEQDRNPQPATAVSAKKRPTRTSRISEQRWDRLQREFRQAVWAEYPNPGRKDCPATDALRDLAERVVLREDLQKDLRWKHAMQCGPCYEEYIALKDNGAVGGNNRSH
jgi:hypothetical protein